MSRTSALCRSLHSLTRTALGESRIVTSSQRGVNSSSAPTPPSKLLTYRPSDFDRKLLVFANSYPNLESIPEVVTFRAMKIARDQVYLKVTLATFVACFVGAGYFIYLGKQEKKNKNTASKGIIEEHREYYERLNKNIISEYLGDPKGDPKK